MRTSRTLVAGVVDRFIVSQGPLSWPKANVPDRAPLPQARPNGHMCHRTLPQTSLSTDAHLDLCFRSCSLPSKTTSFGPAPNGPSSQADLFWSSFSGLAVAFVGESNHSLRLAGALSSATGASPCIIALPQAHSFCFHTEDEFVVAVTGPVFYALERRSMSTYR